MRILFLFLSCSLSFFSWTQSSLSGVVRNQYAEILPYLRVALSDSAQTVYCRSDEFGRYYFKDLLAGNYEIEVTSRFHENFKATTAISFGKNELNITIKDTLQLGVVSVYHDSPYNTRSMRMVEGVTLTNGKKTQHIDIKKIDGNSAINNARELYAKVPGLNIWESDGGGLQLGIGARGLSPSRTAHFNTRQNGYDISADALGYPETYYTPPSEALESIQLIRGAASLQFGPQFGGMLNFNLAPASKKHFQYNGSQTYGAYNLFNTFNSVSGTLKKRFSYLAYFQYKKGDGWRPNSGFNQQTGFAQLKYQFTEKMFLSIEQTYMSYLAQQAGGLTDAMFNQNARQSIRERNWFKVNWNITAANFYWELGEKTTLDIKAFSVNASRISLGNLEKISRVDDMKERTIIAGDFQNIGGELRILKRYPIGKNKMGILASGVRYYQGTTVSKQGLGSSGSTADFDFLNPTSLEDSDYRFPSQNMAAFVENIVRMNTKLSFSAGIRYEYISTAAEGYYKEQIFHPLTGTLIFDSTYFEEKFNARSILLGGIGFSYRADKNIEVYGNIAQNYRGINFSDIRINNPNQEVDPSITDEKGFNTDLGVRGIKRKIYFDASAFFLYYDNKIGVINKRINEYEIVRLRTNLGKAYSTGVEFFAERSFAKTDSSKSYFSAYTNLSFVYARYGKHEDAALSQNWVELVPPITAKVGIKYTLAKWKFSLLSAYVHKHYSDGTNAKTDPNAIAGIIPSYYIIDYSNSFEMNKFFTFKAGVNNLTNNHYFTRRSTSYPGPGIIPSDGISFYFTLVITL